MPAPASVILVERQLELQAAIAAQRVENVAGEALRVDADQRRRGVDVAHDQGDKAFDFLDGAGAIGGRRLVHALKAENAECAPAGREIGFGDFFDAFQCHRSIVKELSEHEGTKGQPQPKWRG